MKTGDWKMKIEKNQIRLTTMKKKKGIDEISGVSVPLEIYIRVDSVKIEKHTGELR